jgi:hypothetical protein
MLSLHLFKPNIFYENVSLQEYFLLDNNGKI